MKISVQTNIAQVIGAMETYQSEVVDKAVVLALDRCAEMARTAAVRWISAHYNLKSGAVKNALTLKKANGIRQTATLSAKRAPMPLFQFGARKTSTGVSVQVKRNRRVTVKGAFLAKMPSGHEGVFVRESNSRHIRVVKNGRVRYSQLPIKELFGPSMGAIFASPELQDIIEKVVRATFKKRMEHEIKRLLSRRQSPTL